MPPGVWVGSISCRASVAPGGEFQGEGGRLLARLVEEVSPLEPAGLPRGEPRWEGDVGRPATARPMASRARAPGEAAAEPWPCPDPGGDRCGREGGRWEEREATAAAAAVVWPGDEAEEVDAALPPGDAHWGRRPSGEAAWRPNGWGPGGEPDATLGRLAVAGERAAARGETVAPAVDVAPRTGLGLRCPAAEDEAAPVRRCGKTEAGPRWRGEEEREEEVPARWRRGLRAAKGDGSSEPGPSWPRLDAKATAPPAAGLVS